MHPTGRNKHKRRKERECHMKKLLALLIALVMVLSLAACGKEPAPASPTGPAPETQSGQAPGADALPFTEEEPPQNALDPASPIPGINFDYPLTEQVFEEENLILRLPEGVSAENEGRGQNMGHITVTDREDGWKLMFRPDNFSLGNLVNNVSATLIYDGNEIKTDWSQDVPGTLAGFPIRVWANNIRPGWLHPSNESDAPGVDIVMDYGETLVGEWLGMHIRLEALEPKDDTNIYHYLYNSKLRAVLNSFAPIETPGGVELTANGITATFPARWPVKTGENSMVALLHSDALSGGISMSTQYQPDPQQHADSYPGQQFTRTYGDNDWIGVVAEHTFDRGQDAPPTVLHSMYLFSAFNDKMCASVHVDLTGADQEALTAFLDNSQFVALMESVKLDPAGWHQPGTAEVNGLLSSSGRIMSYSGTEEELEIPAVIGEYNTVYIGPGAFADNATLKKVVIPEGVTELQPNAFSGCANLETVVLPETLNYIYTNAFRDCPKLKDVVLPGSVSYVGFAAFEGSGAGSFTGSSAQYDSHCFEGSTFERISLPAGSDLSGDYIFSGMQTAQVELPADLTALGRGAFTGSRAITRLDLPDTLRQIGPSAFSNMGGLPYVKLPEGLEEIPENCFNSTTLDVLVIPASVKVIGDYATFSGAYILLQNPEVQIGYHALNADYIYLTGAKDFVFPADREVFVGSRLYLEGIYDPAQLQGDLYNGTAISNQIYLPSDATETESDAMDAYLASIGYDEISWIGSAWNFMPEDTFGFDVQNCIITGYHGESKKLSVPDYALYLDDDWWLTQNVYGIADGAFKDSGFTEAYFRGNCGDGIGARILEGNTALRDIWFTTQLLFDEGNYDPEAFVGIPENVTVHLPDSMTEEQRAWAENYLHSIGIPESAAFAYYSLR